MINKRVLKILLLSLIFYFIGGVITYAMWSLWDWLFTSNFWKIIFNVITFLGSMKYFWKHTNWTIEQLKIKK
jgi:hypothetical protein